MTGPVDPAPQPPGPATTYPVALPVPIRTERLLLRPWRPDDDVDRTAYRRLMGDPDVVRYLYDQVLDPPAADRQLSERQSTITGPGEWMNLAVELADGGGPVGDVGLAWMGDDHRQAEIGYTILPVHHGAGYATEAAAAMVA